MFGPAYGVKSIRSKMKDWNINLIEIIDLIPNPYEGLQEDKKNKRLYQELCTIEYEVTWIGQGLLQLMRPRSRSLRTNDLQISRFSSNLQTFKPSNFQTFITMAKNARSYSRKSSPVTSLLPVTEEVTDDIWVRKTSTTVTTTLVEDTSAKIREESAATEATELILPPKEAVTTPTPAPPIIESSIIEDDEKAMDEEHLAKKTRTSTLAPPPPSQLTQTFGQEDFDRLFEEAGTSVVRAERAHIDGFSYLVISQKMTKSYRAPRNHAKS
ncbi:hypothetical protein RND71_038180 [Anisodus tanguticus]|uniref:Ycf2 N-terminal domain-containing protein n=1 Tax=Anisodus tanguticus TaxID=243964 RepID=A0AAE1R083_9SOLA|nr:hypothetical protein RND71_038180 [Anisodus tanguticus]